jgi:hypothetical protein
VQSTIRRPRGAAFSVGPLRETLRLSKPQEFPRIASRGPAARAAVERRRRAAVEIHSHASGPFRHTSILPIFVENEPPPSGH